LVVYIFSVRLEITEFNESQLPIISKIRKSIGIKIGYYLYEISEKCSIFVITREIRRKTKRKREGVVLIISVRNSEIINFNKRRVSYARTRAKDEFYGV